MEAKRDLMGHPQLLGRVFLHIFDQMDFVFRQKESKMIKNLVPAEENI